MKSENLQFLQQNQIAVPPFLVVSSAKEIDLSFSQAGLFAVRSSYEGEDCSESSYAGQLETMLNVPREQVKEAVEKVFSSIHSERMGYYQEVMGLQCTGMMRIIIQEMVPSKLSGVMFTANPQGLLNEMVVVVGEGLGNGVVEDAVPTTSYYYNTSDEIYYYETSADSPLLPDDMLQELLTTGRKIEQLFQKKMDIEFAIAEGGLYILQARPITTLSKEKEIVLDNSNIVESYPGISLPATEDFVKMVYHKVFASCLFRLTKSKKVVEEMEEVTGHMVASVNGRIYYEISNWYNVILLLPCSKKIIPIWQEMLGVTNKEVSKRKKTKRHLWVKGRVALSFVGLLLSTPRRMKKLNAYYAAVVPEYKQRIVKATPIECLHILHEMMEDLGSKWDITLTNDMYTFLYTALAKRKHSKDLCGVKELASLEPIIKMQQLVDTETVYGMDSTQYEQEKELYLDTYGDRCLEELKLETVTMRVKPELLDEYVRQEKGKQEEIVLQKERMEKDSKQLSFVTKRAIRGIRNREISRMNRGRLFGIARSIYLVLGDYMVKQGCLATREDVFYLHFHEMEAIEREACNYQEVVQERKERYAMYGQLPAYSRLVFAGRTFNKAPLNVNSQPVRGDSERLQGIPCSEGVAEGYVLVVDMPDMSLDTTDKILVTRMTDPGWIFLIQRAKGIIAEKGSLLSHTAIVTRELHKPSVVSVPQATTLLKTGDYVRLNGMTGEIIKIEAERSK